MEVRPGLAISSVVHAVILGWGLIAFTPKPLESKPVEAMPIDLVPISEITQNKAGAKKPPKPEAKPLVEKKAEPKEMKELVEKVSKQPEIKEASAPPPPSTEEKKEAAKPAEKPEAKPEPKKEAEAEKPLPPKKPEPPKKQPKAKSEAKMKAAPNKKHEFDPNKIAALLDRREAQRHETSDLRAPAPTGLGVPHGKAEQISMSAIDALRRRLMQLWNPPAGAKNPEELVVSVHMQLNRDGTLAGPPRVLTSGSSPLFLVARENAMRAVFMGQPYTMLSPDKYDLWKDIEITFDPRDMVGG